MGSLIADDRAGVAASGGLAHVAKKGDEMEMWSIQIEATGLVIHARDDGLVDWSDSRYAAASIAGAESMTIERGGHLLLERYDAIRTRVVVFLKEPGG